MTKTFQGGALLLGALALTLIAQVQTAQAQNSRPLSADVAVTYTAERAKIATTDCACFWLQGGAVDAAVPLFRGLAVAANLTGLHSASIVPGVDLNKLTYMAGPRYNLSTSRWARHLFRLRLGSSIFGEALFGRSHGFDSAFPSASGPKSSADALAMQFGGGLNIGLRHGFGLRAIEVDYVRTNFRNSTNDTQNDLRLAMGVTYHIGER